MDSKKALPKLFPNKHDVEPYVLSAYPARYYKNSNRFIPVAKFSFHIFQPLQIIRHQHTSFLETRISYLLLIVDDSHISHRWISVVTVSMQLPYRTLIKQQQNGIANTDHAVCRNDTSLLDYALLFCTVLFCLLHIDFSGLIRPLQFHIAVHM